MLLKKGASSSYHEDDEKDTAELHWNISWSLSMNYDKISH